MQWPLVDAEDLTTLYGLALDGAAPGTVLHAAAVWPWPLPATWPPAVLAPPDDGRWRKRPRWWGALAQALACDQALRADAARTLGWRPSRPGIIEDLVAGSYGKDRS